MPFCEACGYFHPSEYDLSFDTQAVPERDVLEFGPYWLSEDYREALYNDWPNATVEEIIGTFLGYNPLFPSHQAWVNMNTRSDESDGGTTDTETMTND
jgi:hypothetical protein